MTSTPAHVMSGPNAAAAAGITYRQLDYWARQGWIQASQVEEVSPGRRVRWYRRSDIARLAALRHLARSGHDVASYGPQVGRVDLVPGVLLVVGGDPEQLHLIPAEQLAPTVTSEGRWTVFDPTPLLASGADHDTETPAVGDERRTA